VLFRIEDLSPYCFIGERESLKVLPMPVQAVADCADTRLLIISGEVIGRLFTRKEQEKLLIMSIVNFPDKKQVVSEVDVVKQAHSIRKRAFLNAVNRNKFAFDMRPEMIHEDHD
jgi:hypothetical protein